MNQDVINQDAIYCVSTIPYFLLRKKSEELL